MPTHLDQSELETMASLLRRAVENRQLSIGVQSPFDSPEDDLFDEGDRHDGNQIAGDDWIVEDGTMQHEDDEPIPYCSILIPQTALDFVANGY